MWDNLPVEKKATYKKLITNFASLSEAFAQKSDDDKKEIIAPIVNSKFQESAFKKAFNATIEDIGNSSYDASLKVSDDKKYIVGIKSFGIASGYQKIAQFKSASQQNNWNAYIESIKHRDWYGDQDNSINIENIRDYQKLAVEIATLRNKRIDSSKNQLRGFENDSSVEGVYHVLMPSKKVTASIGDDEPYIVVGEVAYEPINIEQIHIDESFLKERTPQNFRFDDGTHAYQYSSADSQLLMSFRGDDVSAETKSSTNMNIAVDKWSVNYIEDAFQFFLTMNAEEDNADDKKITQSFSWKISTEKRSGFNAWYGAPKNPIKKDSKRYIRIIELAKENKVDQSWINKFNDIINGEYKTNAEKDIREKLRDEVTNEVKDFPALFELVTASLWRNYNTPYETYIPIPNSKQFNLSNPNFFNEDAGILDGKKLKTSKENRSFILEFLPSNDKMEMFINQDYGKAIQSLNSQFIFGKWVLKQVFQLQDRELLTESRLEELGINGIRFKKYDDGSVSMEFIEIDDENIPEDFWE